MSEPTNTVTRRPTANSSKRIRRWWQFWLVFLGTPFLAVGAVYLHPILTLILAGWGSIAAGFLLAGLITRNPNKQLSLGIACWLGVAVIYLGLIVVWALFGSHIQ